MTIEGKNLPHLVMHHSLFDIRYCFTSLIQEHRLAEEMRDLRAVLVYIV